MTIQIDGVGPPLVTPFTREGDVDYDRLRELVGWVESRGVDFLVPCGTTSEAELLTNDERAKVIETVVDVASVPVIAGTGHPGLRETTQSIERAAVAGADAALVVTPFYYSHSQKAFISYYREVAGRSDLPVYLYSVPAYTDAHLEPETVGALADHPNIVGIKDSSGLFGRFTQTQRRVDTEFTLLVGSASLLASSLAAGGDGAILAVANLHPESAAAVPDLVDRDPARANSETSRLNEIHQTVFEYGIPGLKWAMRERSAPAGYPRSPHQPLTNERQKSLRQALDAI